MSPARRTAGSRQGVRATEIVFNRARPAVDVTAGPAMRSYCYCLCADYAMCIVAPAASETGPWHSAQFSCAQNKFGRPPGSDLLSWASPKNGSFMKSDCY